MSIDIYNVSYYPTKSMSLRRLVKDSRSKLTKWVKRISHRKHSEQQNIPVPNANHSCPLYIENPTSVSSCDHLCSYTVLSSKYIFNGFLSTNGHHKLISNITDNSPLLEITESVYSSRSHEETPLLLSGT